MNRIPISSIKDKDIIESTYLVKSKTLNIGKTGKHYISLTLMDRTGEIEARIWDDALEFSKLFNKDDVIIIRGNANLYQGKIQLSINNLRKCDVSQINFKEFLPAIDKDVNVMFNDVKRYIDSIKNIYLKQLLNLTFEDNEIAIRFKKAPAAKSIHHVYIGGLIDHTLSVMRNLEQVIKNYPELNSDLLISGALLHDIGKIYELTFDKTFDYSDRGRLIGHIVIGVQIVDDKIRQIKDFPEELKLLLEHIILSHHGKLEFGSPQTPKTLEALAIHYIEDMDAKINAFKTIMNKEKESESKWTSFNKLFYRHIYKEKYQNELLETVDGE